MGLSGDALAAWVEASCSAQGVPVKVADAAVVGRVVVLLDGGPPAKRAKPAADGASPSELPDDSDSVRVELSGTGCSGLDVDVGDDSSDDGGLSGEVQVLPRGL